MNKIMTGLCATALAASFATANLAVANAAPLMKLNSDTSIGLQTDQVAWRGRGNHRGVRHHNGGAYFHGHRGYRHQRRGYREHNGYWFPLAAFATGALITGAIANSGGRTSHEQYCYDRYRSYRASDNTFQPYHGPRQQCR